MKYLKRFNESINIGEIKIEKIQKEDIDKVVDMASKIFSNVMPYEANQQYIRSVTDFNLSCKLTNDGNIIGCYLIAPKQLKKLEGKKGLEGIALAIKPEYRGNGLGEKLKDWFENYAKDNDYDFIFGQHLKGLHNIDSWLKRREIYKEDKHSFYTIKYLK